MIGWFSCLGEPNDHHNNEDCARLEKNGQWSDIPCIGKSYGSICEVGKYVNKSHLFYCTKYEKKNIYKNSENTLFLYVLGSSACKDNTHLNNLLESTSTNTVNGWTIDCNEGVWTTQQGDCKNWYGWGSSHEVGSIATTLSGSGRARLDFGNCHDTGTVKAFLDGQEIESADALIPHKVVEFNFNPGSVLRMSEYDIAVIQFNTVNNYSPL